ncbi:MAG: response regulator [Opitutales bacterium]
MSHPSRILVIDDNELFARTVQRMLQRKGVEVEVAFDGEQGLSMATALRFDLVILDLVMPKLDGFELIRRLRKEAHCPRLIAMSGNVSVQGPVSLQSALEVGAHAVLEKPFSQEKLFEQVFKIMATVSRFPTPRREVPSPCRARLFA